MTPQKPIQLEGFLDAPPFDARVSKLAGKFVGCWSYPLLRRKWAGVLLLLLITGLCGLRAYIGLTGTQNYSHDAFMLLDGAWRMMNGQLPHRDFYSHLGVLTYAPTAVGLWISGGSATGYGYAQAFVGLTLGFWSYWLGRRYLQDVPACLLCVAVVLLAISTSQLGDPPGMVAGMTYNRQGYAILAVILLETLAGRTAALKRNDFPGGLSTGSALAILLFLKITYFVFGVFVVAALIPVRPQGKRRWAGLATGFAGISAAVCAYLRFDLIPMCKDLATIFRAKHFHLLFFAFDTILQEVATFLIFVFMATVLLFLHQERRAARAVAAGGLVVSVTSLLIFGNYEQSGFQMAAFLAIIAIDIISTCIPVDLLQTSVLHVSVLLLASAFVLTSVTSGVISLSEATVVRLTSASRSPGLGAPRLETFKPVSNDVEYRAFVNDGLTLLSKHRIPGETVMSLDFTNPFSYGLGIRPARGGTTVLQYRTTFDDKHRQSAESLFGSADLVMLPQPGRFSDGTLDYSIVRIYGPYLNKHFKLVATSLDWRLYRHNPA